ncbi:non-ribosomal peptide synthetase [Dictyobacter kobayashii]|uniref:Carrier domain-containing protein n=1 Tax=Dictyobacter kobayashii TaxID=2014872 RepID=A0A402AP50_9CHLR|nr:non-ribosomal peptide synthetase [Dictyobacter kobayashii]GCE20971.1 hypothetical protein KDK_47710 [Dictyobacter kobayashii]
MYSADREGTMSDDNQLINDQTSIIDLLLSDEEKQQLTAWNATQQTLLFDKCIPQLIAMQATACPDAPAIVADQRTITYRQLNQRANQLAHYLQQLGVGPEVAVALCLERTPELLIALLGILKAGGAYIPLDPAYPTERLNFLLTDAGAHVLISQQHILKRINPPDLQVIALDKDEVLIAQQSSDDPAVSISAEDLAYVIYTSGSTGLPKGVQITHKSLLNLVYWHQQAFGVTAVDRATHLTSPAFDATGWEIWPYLAAGASLYLVDEGLRTSPPQLRDWLVQQQITITFLPTALAENALLLSWPATTSLRYMLTGADILHYYPPATLPFMLVNNYGPSEATVLVTSGHILPTSDSTQLPPIGRVIANTQLYLLDEEGHQVPIGQPGEIHIGGIGLARGYLNRPELTAEKFVQRTLHDGSRVRLYKTGDLARFLPDGQLAFMGRIDDQIKIRGFRIEPNEIEFVLNSYPAIQSSVVIAREDASSDKHLVAYVVLFSNEPIVISSLYEFLSKRLPEYMIPTVFIKMEKLPMTAHGKIDRKQLPVPDEANTLRDGELVLPATLTEVSLSNIVAPLLGLEQISIDENFFMLGGHSLLGTQIIAHISKEFSIDLPLRTLFEAPTIQLLAGEVEQRVLAKVESMSEDEVLRLLEQG